MTFLVLALYLIVLLLFKPLRCETEKLVIRGKTRKIYFYSQMMKHFGALAGTKFEGGKFSAWYVGS